MLFNFYFFINLITFSVTLTSEKLAHKKYSKLNLFDIIKNDNESKNVKNFYDLQKKCQKLFIMMPIYESNDLVPFEKLLKVVILYLEFMNYKNSDDLIENYIKYLKDFVKILRLNSHLDTFHDFMKYLSIHTKSEIAKKERIKLIESKHGFTIMNIFDIGFLKFLKQGIVNFKNAIFLILLNKVAIPIIENDLSIFPPEYKLLKDYLESPNDVCRFDFNNCLNSFNFPELYKNFLEANYNIVLAGNKIVSSCNSCTNEFKLINVFIQNTISVLRFAYLNSEVKYLKQIMVEITLNYAIFLLYVSKLCLKHFDNDFSNANSHSVVELLVIEKCIRKLFYQKICDYKNFIKLYNIDNFAALQKFVMIGELDFTRTILLMLIFHKNHSDFIQAFKYLFSNALKINGYLHFHKIVRFQMDNLKIIRKFVLEIRNVISEMDIHNRKCNLSMNIDLKPQIKKQKFSKVYVYSKKQCDQIANNKFSKSIGVEEVTINHYLNIKDKISFLGILFSVKGNAAFETNIIYKNKDLFVINKNEFTSKMCDMNIKNEICKNKSFWELINNFVNDELKKLANLYSNFEIKTRVNVRFVKNDSDPDINYTIINDYLKFNCNWLNINKNIIFDLECINRVIKKIKIKQNNMSVLMNEI